MTRQRKELRKPLAAIAFAALLLALVGVKFTAMVALGCIATSALSWVPLELLHAGLMLVSWHCLPLYLADASRVADHVWRIGAWFSLFLCALSGWL